MTKKQKVQPLYAVTEEDEDEKQKRPIIQGILGLTFGIVTGISLLAILILLLTYEAN